MADTPKTFTPEEVEIIGIVSKVCSSLSIFGSFTILILFWFFKENRSIDLELIVWYGISNSLYLITVFFPFNPLEKDYWCAIQSFTMTCFQIGSRFWSCIIGYVAFISVIRKNHLEKHKTRYRILFLFISFGISALLASM